MRKILKIILLLTVTGLTIGPALYVYKGGIIPDKGIYVIGWLLNIIFWIWVIFLGGAEWLEGSFLSGLLVWFHAPEWTAEGIKIFGWFALMGSTLWIFIRLFY